MTRPTGTPGFEFPPLGPTGEGDPPYPGMAGQGYWVPEQHTGYWVTHQGDRPAVAFRCHYPGGASPCDQETADRFIAWAASQGSRLAVGDIVATDRGGRRRILNPDWPSGTDPFCEPADADEPVTHPDASDLS